MVQINVTLCKNHVAMKEPGEPYELNLWLFKLSHSFERSLNHALANLERPVASEWRWTELGRTEPLFLRSALGSQSRGRTLAEALSRDDAAAGGSRARATTPRATQASRPSQAIRRDRV